VNKSSQLKSDQKSRFFQFYRDARDADLTHLSDKTWWFRGFCAIFLLNDRWDMDFFWLKVLILRYSTKEKGFLPQLPGYFFHNTLKTSIFRLISVWHRVKIAAFSSSEFKNHFGNRMQYFNQQCEPCQLQVLTVLIDWDRWRLNRSNILKGRDFSFISLSVVPFPLLVLLKIPRNQGGWSGTVVLV